MPPGVIIIMGVSGAGKTTVGRALAEAAGWKFADADDFHPEANRAKMSAGIALTDTDRAPWLDTLRKLISEALAANDPLVLACSALKGAYRDLLAVDADRVRFVHLHGSSVLLAARIGARAGHFAPPALLDSQLATLEPPADALALDVAASPAELVSAICSHFGLPLAGVSA